MLSSINRFKSGGVYHHAFSEQVFLLKYTLQ